MNRDINIKVKLMFSEEKRPYLSDISSLLYDFELLHDFSLLLCADDYSGYKFSRFFWYRNGRPLKADHKVRTTKILKESPLIVELIIAEVAVLCGALWAFVQAIEKISNRKLNKEKLILEVKKLEREIVKADLEVEKTRIELEQKVREKEALNVLRSLIRRLEDNPIELTDIEFYVEENGKEK